MLELAALLELDAVLELAPVDAVLHAVLELDLVEASLIVLAPVLDLTVLDAVNQSLLESVLALGLGDRAGLLADPLVDTPNEVVHHTQWWSMAEVL